MADTAYTDQRADYAAHPGHRCPRCKSPAPHLHPAAQLEGEVSICDDEYHLTPTNQNRPQYIASVAAALARVEVQS